VFLHGISSPYLTLWVTGIKNLFFYLFASGYAQLFQEFQKKLDGSEKW